MILWAAFCYTCVSQKTGFAPFANAHRPRRYAPAVDGFAATPGSAALSHKDVQPTSSVGCFYLNKTLQNFFFPARKTSSPSASKSFEVTVYFTSVIRFEFTEAPFC